MRRLDARIGSVGWAAALSRGQEMLARPEMDESERVLSAFSSFVAEHSEATGASKTVLLTAYTGFLAIVGYRASSISTRIQALTALLGDPVDIAEAERRLAALRLRTAVKRLRGTEVLNVKPLFALSVFASVLAATSIRRQTDTSTRWKCIFYLLIVTGMRPKHLFGIRELAWKEDALWVKWGPRKIHIVAPTDFVVYSFSWTMPPPPELLYNFKHSFGDNYGIPLLSTKQNIASSCNSWLSTLGLGLTRVEKHDGRSGLSSCCPRVYLSTLLGGRVVAGEMGEKEFEILLDHNVESSFTFYRRIGEPITLTQVADAADTVE